MVGQDRTKDDISQESPFIAVSDSLNERVLDMLDEGDVSLEDIPELVGYLSMSTMTRLIAEGAISPKDAQAFLKSMADKKTPDPVHKIEQHTKIDINVILAKAVNDNPQALVESTRLAKERHEEIMERLNLGPDMMLPPSDDDTTDAVDAEFTLPEPIEVKDIRQNGDGSIRRQEFKQTFGGGFKGKWKVFGDDPAVVADDIADVGDDPVELNTDDPNDLGDGR